MSKSATIRAAAGQRTSLRRENGVAEEVFQVLRSDILSLRIPPNTRILIDDFARKLGVSQTPIREALRQLEVMGLVTKQHFVGYCSAPQLTRKQFDELFEMRFLLEPYAARCAATRMSDSMLAAAKTLVAKMHSNRNVSCVRFAEQDAKLHDLIAAGSDNQIVQDTLSRLHLHFHIFRLGFRSELTRESAGEHNRLVDALVARDPDESEEAMRDHIQRSYERLASFAAAEEMA